MFWIAWCMAAAAVLPYGAALAAKAGGRHFDNDNPRAWLAAQEGWRARANAAQNNLFESLPFFYAAVLYALYLEASASRIAVLMALWIVLRIAYVAAYITGKGTLRSLIWAAALAVNFAILWY